MLGSTGIVCVTIILLAVIFRPQCARFIDRLEYAKFGTAELKTAAAMSEEAESAVTNVSKITELPEPPIEPALEAMKVLMNMDDS